MNEAVFDSSAVLALLLAEGGSPKDKTRELTRAVVSTVNLLEIYSKLFELKRLDAVSIENGIRLIGRIEPLTIGQARMAAELRLTTRHLGLSLGDRACLALALDLGLDVYTADRAWKQAQVGCAVHLIR